ncbi:hypothetical protein Slin15195_G126910 [Septoria linicola]|uniref:VanZ-like domain-containing protein n=1 Tax=Septoria linicola TaxID=215465 RepID=A0A9Q9ER00_9PEZI|nr:hypothetical protein Slin15195_G126910 [Septoria linicola]
MPAGLRVRKPFAGAFAALLLASAYLGLSTSKIPTYGQSDKGLHLVTFFLLTTKFYWILETTRRRAIHLTLLTVTAGLSIGSEVVQALLPNGREFDPFDILANVVGSTGALLLSSWYHKRMLERKRKNKTYDIVPGEEDVDVELGEGPGLGAQESGVTDAQANGGAVKSTDVTQELDNWDENEEDWEEEGAEAGNKAEDEPSKKRAD